VRVALAAAIVLATAGAAAANPYEAYIDIETEDDLYDLVASQQITQETFEVLIDLLHRGVDLNRAGRAELYSLPNLTYDDVDAILAYRKEQGFIRDPAELVRANVVTEDRLLSIAPFLVVRDPFAELSSVHGFVQAQSQYTAGDDEVMPVALRARVMSGRHLTAGIAVVETRLRAGEVVYDPNRDALLVEAPGAQAHVPKIYVHWQGDAAQAIAGTYRIGFGQRLTFDTSSDYTPNGIYRDDQLYRSLDLARECNQGQGELAAAPCTDDHRYLTDDLRWREALLGAAAGVDHLPIADGWLQLYAWGSYQPRSVYQYEIYDRTACADPRADDDPACKAPDVFVRPDGDVLDPAGELQYSTLPDMYAEALAGANATFFASRRSYVGVTAYGARDRWLVDDGAGGEMLDLDFQEWSSRPSGGEFGALGLASSIGVQSFDVGGEVAHSFDTMDDTPGAIDGGGGPAGIVRATYTDPGRHEVELSARYYDTNFLNPFARPIAAPDELEGQRARDELGTRVRYTGQTGALRLRAAVDGWRTVSTGVGHAEGYLRADVEATRDVGWGLWLDVHDKDRSALCDPDSGAVTASGDPLDCKGRRGSGTGRVRWRVSRLVSLAAQAGYELIDEGDDGTRQDLSAWVTATWRPTQDLRLRARIRYLDEDLADAASLERSVWTYIEGWQRLFDKDRLRVRADLYWWLDERDRTMIREPQPELRLWAIYESRF